MLALVLGNVAAQFGGPVFGQSIYSTPYTITTLAGSPANASFLSPAGGFGSTDGVGPAARFSALQALAVDDAGNVYVSDTGNNLIRRVTPDGTVTTLAGQAEFAGYADGTGTNALFNTPAGIAVDASTNVYVADWWNCVIRKLTPDGTNWVVTTIAGAARVLNTNDGVGTDARFGLPYGLALDTAGNLYVSDYQFNTIRKMTPVGTNWLVTTIAGQAQFDQYRNPIPGTNDGVGTSAQFGIPMGIAVDAQTNIYVADSFNYTVRKVSPVGTNWVVTTIAGQVTVHGSTDGLGASASFGLPNNTNILQGPLGVAVDAAGDVFVADGFNNTIRKLTLSGTNWMVTTVAGTPPLINHGVADGTGSNARLDLPFGLATDAAGSLYIADTWNATIRKGFPAASVPQPVLCPAAPGAGQVGFGITGLANLSVDILRSTNLSSWQVVSNYVLTNGTNFCVTPASSQPVQFYRAHVR